MSSNNRNRVVLALAAGVLIYLAIDREVVTRSTGVFLLVLLPAVIIHEVSHGALAYLFGDDTAKRAGRLTLNPIPHIDPFGTIVLPGILALAGAPPFGYARPVPVNVRRLRRPRNQSLMVSLVGPGVNIAMALMAVAVARVFLTPLDIVRWGVDAPQVPLAHDVLLSFSIVNVVLAAFNLIPIPPLDGSAVIERLLPASWWEPYLRLRQYSMLVLFALIFLIPGGISFFTGPAIDLWARTLT